MRGLIISAAVVLSFQLVEGADARKPVTSSPLATNAIVSTVTNSSSGKLTPSISTVQDEPGYSAHIKYADRLEPTPLELENAWRTYKKPIGTNSLLRIEVLPKQQYVTTGDRDVVPTLHRESYTSLPREERIGPQPGITLFRFTRLPIDKQNVRPRPAQDRAE